MVNYWAEIIPEHGTRIGSEQYEFNTIIIPGQPRVIFSYFGDFQETLVQALPGHRHRHSGRPASRRVGTFGEQN